LLVAVLAAYAVLAALALGGGQRGRVIAFPGRVASFAGVMLAGGGGGPGARAGPPGAARRPAANRRSAGESQYPGAPRGRPFQGDS
jgi:hypothetical protein